MIGEAGKAKLHVGYKQTVRALAEGRAAEVYIAEDCDDYMKNSIAEKADANGTPVNYVPTMKELGQMCEIDIGASCAVVLK